MSASIEPESVFVGGACAYALHVPRLVAPYDMQSKSLAVEFTEVRRSLDAHISQAMAGVDMDLLIRGYGQLETLCQQVLLPMSPFTTFASLTSSLPPIAVHS